MSTTEAQVQVVDLAGDVDGFSSALRERVSSALESGQPVLVDLTDCTYLDVAALRELDESFHRARHLGVGFVVVLPFYAAHGVSRLLLELAPELVRYAVVPNRTAAARALGAPAPVDLRYLQALRARLWELARRREELDNQRDALILELRRNLGARKTRSTL